MSNRAGTLKLVGVERHRPRVPLAETLDLGRWWLLSFVWFVGFASGMIVGVFLWHIGPAAGLVIGAVGLAMNLRFVWRWTRNAQHAAHGIVHDRPGVLPVRHR